ncbi:hypothetical protein [Methanoplanus endosymbiosus]|uniref:Uncharacterized protein n=1 Tax=Methanoplanus endosymbiosus TaxID=33865 RepID=A0A9E7TMK4_9EURY|nr:hypothetical protein [Methanoplanus endosymbiosus]UUX93361.1 hypothetical protein L6E24_04330 [Methanoplanus endosymbiosus]
MSHHSLRIDKILSDISNLSTEDQEYVVSVIRKGLDDTKVGRQIQSEILQKREELKKRSEEALVKL